MRAKHGNGNGHGKSLNVEVQRMRVWIDAEGPDAPPGDGYWTMAERLLPTPTTRDQKGENQRGDDTCLTGALLPPPSVADSTGGHERRGGARGEELLLKGVARAVADGALLPTPTAMDSRASGGNPDTTGTHGTMLTDATVRQPSRWGDYEAAIRRHERMLGRSAPAPTKLNAKGNPKLSDEFDEWLMGLPAGWITDVPGITWNEALKACGNGVVPAQAVYAIRLLLQRITTTQAAPTGRLSCS
jgi:DNA (cytosine-5)-methyltransferase 1